MDARTILRNYARTITNGEFGKLKGYLKNSALLRLEDRYNEPKIWNMYKQFKPFKKAYDLRFIPKKKIAIISHDDDFDKEMYDYGVKKGINPSFMLLSYERHNHRIKQKNADLQLHYDKRYPTSFRQQLLGVKKISGKAPIINRNHTLWWTHDHLEFGWMHMHGIKVDSTKCGPYPYMPSFDGRVLPMWEVPINVFDAKVTEPSAGHGLWKDMELPFQQGFTPINALMHPYLKHKNNWKQFYKLAYQYNYEIMGLTEFYEKYLKKQTQQTLKSLR